MKEDKKYYNHPFGDIPIEEVQSRINECDVRARLLQDDFFDTMVKLIDETGDGDGMEKEKNRIYYVRKMKELQKQINIQFNYTRQLQLDLSKTALEDAFSPHIKSLLIKSYQDRIKELEEEDDV
jgi:hypothetical protein